MVKQEIINFEKTLKELKSYLDLEINNNRDRAGIIQAFEFTFEQSGKSIQKIAGKSGLQVGTPKQAYTAAIQSGWIKREEEDSWLQLLEDRNLTSHTYKEDVAKEVLKRIQLKYVKMFDGLLEKLKGE